jgi:hypothetical protein
MSQGVNLTTIDDLLDNIFADVKMEDLVPNETSPAWEDVSKAPAENMNKKGGFYLVQLGSTNSAQDSQFAASEFTDYPLPTNSRYARLQVVPIVTRATVQVTDHAELNDKAKYKEMPAKNLDTVVNDIDGEMRYLDRKRSRQIWGNRSNEIATVGSINTATRVVTCDDASNLFGVRHVEEGLRLEYRDANGVLRHDVGGLPYTRVTEVNSSLVTYKYSADTPAPAGVTAADKIYGYGDYNNGWAGVGYHSATTGSWQGISDRSTHNRTRGISIDADGADVSASLLRRMISARRNRIDQSSAKRSGLKFYASAQWDAYEASGFAQQGYADGGADLKRGFKKLFFSDVPFVYDAFVPYDSIFLGDLSKLHKFEMQNFQPIKDGYSYLRRLESADGKRLSPKKQIIFQGVGNLGTNDPAGLGVWLTGLNTADISLGYE